MTDHLFQWINLSAIIITAIAAIVAALRFKQVNLHMNSRLDQLMETTEKLALARGAREALAEDKIERAKAEALVQQPSLTPKPPRTWTWHENVGQSEPEE